MARFRILLAVIALAGTFSLHAQQAHNAVLTESAIRSMHIEYPDSCLGLLDRAQKGKVRTDIPGFRIETLRAMCYEIKGDYPAKEACLRRLLQNDSVRNNDGRKLSATVMLAGVLDRENRYSEGIEACRQAIDLARRLGRKKEEAEMLSTMARICAGMKNDADADKYFRRAVAILQTTKDVRDMAFLSTIYGEMMTFLIGTDRPKEALEIARRRETLIGRMSKMPGPPPGYIDQQYGFLYAKMALLLANQGQAKEAAAIYRKYQALDFARSYTGRSYIVPYLLAAKRYSEALENNSDCLREYPGDTISYDYLTMLQNQAAAYRGTGKYQLADAYMQRCYTVQDSITRREADGKASENAARFNAKEKERQIAEKAAEKRKNKAILIGSLAATALLLLILLIIFRNRRRLRQECGDDAQISDKPTAPMDSEDMEKSEATAETDKDYQAFRQMEAMIVEKELFLNPRLGREDIVRATGIGRNAIAPIIRKYSGCVNLNDYINRLRLEHAVKLMKSNRLYTIDSIAESSGFNSRSTFYRAFQNVFGMSPLQYLELQKNENGDNGDRQIPSEQ